MTAPHSRPGSARRLAFGIAAALGLAALFAACGSGDDATPTPAGTPTPSASPFGLVAGTLVVQADLSAIPTNTDVMPQLTDALDKRLTDAGVTIDMALFQDTLGVEFSSTRSLDFVKQIILAPGVRFQEPVIKEGLIQCKDANGTEFSTQTADLIAIRGSLDCTGPGGLAGSVEWEEATGELLGSTKALTGSMIFAEVPSTQIGQPGLSLSFNPDGTALLLQITARLTNYPLGVFLGDQLLFAPIIVREIDDGVIRIGGPDPEGLDALKAVLKGGELPAPVSVISVLLR